MPKKAQRGVRPEDVVAALGRFFEKFLWAAEQQWRARGDGGTLYAAQVVFRDKLGVELRLDDEVALDLTFGDGRSTQLQAGDALAYWRAQRQTIDSVAADEGSLGHITVLVGRWVQPYLATHPLSLSTGQLWARGIAAWDLRRVLAEAIALVPEMGRVRIELEKELEKEREKAILKRQGRERKKRERENETQEREEDTADRKKQRRNALARLKRWQKKILERESQRREGIAIPGSEAGRELLDLLQPRRALRALGDRLGAGPEEWLANALAETILDRSLERQVAALLPMEYLHVDGQGIVLWKGWLGEKRSRADVMTEKVRGELEKETLGLGFGSRRSKRRVVPVSELGDGGVDLEKLSAAAETSSPLEEAETWLDLERAIPQLTLTERQALALQQQAQEQRITFEEACRRRGVGYVSARKNLERARRHLKSILDQ